MLAWLEDSPLVTWPPVPDRLPHLPFDLVRSVMGFLEPLDRYPFLGVSKPCRREADGLATFHSLITLTSDYQNRLTTAETAGLLPVDQVRQMELEAVYTLWGRLWLQENYAGLAHRVRPSACRAVADHATLGYPAALYLSVKDMRPQYPGDWKNPGFGRTEMSSDDLGRLFGRLPVPLVSWEMAKAWLRIRGNRDMPEIDHFKIEFIDSPAAVARQAAQHKDAAGRYRVRRYVALHRLWSFGLRKYGGLDKWRRHTAGRPARAKRPRPAGETAEEADGDRHNPNRRRRRLTPDFFDSFVRTFHAAPPPRHPAEPDAGAGDGPEPDTDTGSDDD